MRNPWEFDESEPEDETRFPCACGEPTCIGDNTDPTNIRIGTAWYVQACGRHKAIVLGPVAVALLGRSVEVWK